jgi:hypothetical protein
MTHHELPLPDYDNLPTGSIESRIKTLGMKDVRTLLDYEHDHAHRIQVVQLLERRVAELDAGAEPTGGSPLGETPEAHQGQAAPSPKASPAQQGPAQNPPSQGVPTNPAQPRR